MVLRYTQLHATSNLESLLNLPDNVSPTTYKHNPYVKRAMAEAVAATKDGAIPAADADADDAIPGIAGTGTEETETTTTTTMPSSSS